MDEYKPVMMALGNAVVPQQIYPLLKAISEIETRLQGGETVTIRGTYRTLAGTPVPITERASRVQSQAIMPCQVGF